MPIIFYDKKDNNVSMTMKYIKPLALIGALLLFFTFFLTILSYLFTILLIVASGLAMFYTLSIVLSYMSENKYQSKETTQKENISQDDRIDMLKQKYLSGEISEERFEKLLDLEFGKDSKKNIDISKEYSN